MYQAGMASLRAFQIKGQTFGARVEEALHEVLTEDKVTYLTDLDHPRFIMGMEAMCKLSIAWMDRQPAWLSMALPKKSPYMEFFRYATIKVIAQTSVLQ